MLGMSGLSPKQWNTVLIVDSDTVYLDVVAEELKMFDMDCQTAEHADEALFKFHSDPTICVVVAHIRLPRISGIELIRKLSFQKRRNFAGIVTAREATFEDAIAALRQGATDLLLKPVSTDELVGAINRALGTYSEGAGRGGHLVDHLETREKIISYLVSARAARISVLGNREISDIAWHMLLEVALSAHLGRKISVSSACIASQAPPATALRHLTALEAAGLVVRSEDQADRRSSVLTLTEHGQRSLDQVLARLMTKGGLQGSRGMPGGLNGGDGQKASWAP